MDTARSPSLCVCVNLKALPPYPQPKLRRGSHHKAPQSPGMKCLPCDVTLITRSNSESENVQKPRAGRKVRGKRSCLGGRAAVAPGCSGSGLQRPSLLSHQVEISWALLLSKPTTSPPPHSLPTKAAAASPWPLWCPRLAPLLPHPQPESSVPM